MFIASQVSTGEENNLNLRVFGAEGGLEWRQEEPNYLYFGIPPSSRPPGTIRARQEKPEPDDEKGCDFPTVS